MILILSGLLCLAGGFVVGYVVATAAILKEDKGRGPC